MTWYRHKRRISEKNDENGKECERQCVSGITFDFGVAPKEQPFSQQPFAEFSAKTKVNNGLIGFALLGACFYRLPKTRGVK
jgi:hypothetical protein